MDEPELAHRHTREDIFGNIGAQVFGVLASALAGLLFGAGYREARAEEGFPVGVPFGGLAMLIIAGFALSCALSLPGRYRHMWREPAARGWIIIGLLQALVTAVIVSAAGLLTVGGTVDLVTSGQPILSRAAYGLIAGGLIQMLAVLSAFALLILKRELPDSFD